MNVVAENLYSQVNTEGYEYLSIKVIVQHHLNDAAVKCTDKTFINGERLITMIGWELQCRMSDGTTQWLPLKDAKVHSQQGFDFKVLEHILTFLKF